MWLSGGAGAGKSAIAQSLAEQWYDQGILLASFFFSHSDSTRNHIGELVATVVAQVVHIMSTAVKDLILQAIVSDPLLSSRDIFTQFPTLVVKPLNSPIHAGFFQDVSNPSVLIVDGLDECLDRTMQVNILRLIRKALSE